MHFIIKDYAHSKSIISSLFCPLIALNLALFFGVYRERLKKAMITPSFKKPTLLLLDPSSYCPFSNQNDWYSGCRIAPEIPGWHISPVQSSFHLEHGTEMALIILMVKLSKQLDWGRSELLLLLSLTSVFNRVNRGLMNCCLTNTGVHGEVLK